MQSTLIPRLHCSYTSDFQIFDIVSQRYYTKGEPEFEAIKKRNDEFWEVESKMTIEKTKFEAFVDQIADELGYTLEPEAMKTLRDASEIYLANLFKEASAFKGERTTLMPSDLQQAARNA